MKNQKLADNLNATDDKENEHSSSAAELERQDATLGGRLRMIRKGVLNRPVWAFAQMTGRSPATIKRYEAGTAEPGDDFLAVVSELSGVAMDWIKEGGADFLPGGDPVVAARLKRSGAAEDGAAPVSAAKKLSRYPSALDSAAEGMPPSAAVKTGRVSPELLAKVVESVEQWLAENRGKVRVAPDKRAMLIAVCYAHFEGREFQKQEMERFFKLVA